MSTDPGLEPYQPPAGDIPAVASRSRPGWLVTVAVIAIALGGMGVMHALFSVGEIALGDQLQAVMTPKAQPEIEDELNQVIESAQAEVEAVEKQFVIFSAILSLARLAVASALVWGGISCLGGKQAGRNLLVMVFAAALVFEACDTTLQTVIAAQMVAPMEKMGRAMGDALPPDGPPPETLAAIMGFVVWGVMCVYYFFQVAKVGYYLGGLLYLRRRALDPYFSHGELSPHQA